MTLIKEPVFFDISSYLREKYFYVIWGYHPPQEPKWTPQNQFFARLNLTCQCFLISVDISETNTLTWFGGTTSPWGSPKINFQLAQARTLFFFYISTYLRDESFDTIWGITPPRIPQKLIF